MSVVNYYRNTAIQGLCRVYSDYFADSTLCVLLTLQVKLCKQNVDVCKVSNKIRLNPGVGE